jgi:hypothetical protein
MGGDGDDPFQERQCAEEGNSGQRFQLEAERDDLVRFLAQGIQIDADER